MGSRTTDDACNCIGRKEYSEALGHLQLLTSELQKEDERLELGPYLLNQISQSALPSLVEAYSRRPEEPSPNPDFLACCVECYRCLRNACAGCSPSQDLLQSLSILELTQSLLEACLRHQDAQDARLLRCIVQFLGNACVGHSKNQLLMWRKFSSQFRKLILRSDDTLMNYTCMLAHTILQAAPCSPELRELALAELPELLASITFQMTKHSQDSEWGLYVIEDILGIEGSLELCFPQLSLEQRVFVVEVLISMLKREGEQTTGASVENLKHLCSVLVERSAALLQKSTPPSKDSQDPCLVVTLVEALCHASAQHDSYGALCDDQNVLRCVLNLLKGIHVSSEETNAVFANVPDAEGETDVTDHLFGLKRNLVRIIANMTFKKKNNQDLVREHDGIPLLLDQTSIDGKNPYLREWVILAMHNLCEGNPQNQAVVAAINLQALSRGAAHFLSEHGLSGRVSDGKVIIKPAEKS